ncbi:hypothetical protein DSO57_1038844 [Entomophthora muscae]|uniref:Uncharacterized protein n=1 Tax=Entomophthora muscae TaxID=34485 RepID=A0ACC2SC03_9FUNG|nr:hypothetical protein DSO57_1038844 [Entomophthora muscae]
MEYIPFLDKTRSPQKKVQKNVNRILAVVFFTLLIDLFAFTLILPLFPSLISFYQDKESLFTSTDAPSFLGKVLSGLAAFREGIFGSKGTDSRLETALLGGVVGSFFSILQFTVAPFIGKAADRYGRRPVLIISVVGNLISNLVWVVASTFPVFVLSRTFGGLSEGNVQLASAIIADVTTAETRSRSMALVGIAFSLAFTIGPGLSGYCVSKNLFPAVLLPSFVTTHPFSSAAVLACILIIIELVLLVGLLEETKGFRPPPAVTQIQESSSEALINRIHFGYLFIFSGMEFTLPFLALDRFSFTYVQQGKLFGFLGILSVLVQGGYVRRVKGPEKIAKQGMLGCIIGLIVIGLVATMSGSIQYLYLGVAFLAFASATVVSCLTSLLTLAVENQNDMSRSAAALGRFRSYGQLGRALGPIAACSIYWSLGPAACYYVGAISLTLVYSAFLKHSLSPSHSKND